MQTRRSRSAAVQARYVRSSWRNRSALVSAHPSVRPKHVAIVMDGNGRWAQRRGSEAHRGPRGGRGGAVRHRRRCARDRPAWMTVYAFSTENWRRPLDEVRFLMNFNERLLVSRRDELHGKGVRVRFIGRRTGRVPRRVLRRIEETEALTAATAGSRSPSRSTTAAGPSSPTRCGRSHARSRAGRLDPERVDERMLHRASLRARHARPRPARAHLGRAPDLELPAVAARVLGAALSPTCSGPTSAASTSSARSRSTSAATAASARSRRSSARPAGPRLPELPRRGPGSCA